MRIVSREMTNNQVLMNTSAKNYRKKIKSSLYSRYCTNGVMSGSTHHRRLAPRQHSSQDTLQQWRALGDTVPYLTSRRIEPQHRLRVRYPAGKYR